MNRALLVLELALVSGCVQSVVTKKGVVDDENCVGYNMNLENKMPKQKLTRVVQVAESKLVSVYGDSVLRERPWEVRETAIGYEVIGNPGYLRGRKGGVARIFLDKDLNVTSVTHGK